MNGYQLKTLGALLKKGFAFNHLAIPGIDNSPVIERFGEQMRLEEKCLFHSGVSAGKEYFQRLHDRIVIGMNQGIATPVVRFADGEYAFYAKSLQCNGLYKQAESRKTIETALPLHAKCLRFVSQYGVVAPLIHPGNSNPPKRFFYIFEKKDDGGALALRFLNFLDENQIVITGENYIPFYVLYAYLSSKLFAQSVDGKKLCIVNSTYDEQTVCNWFARLQSKPDISFTKIPDCYVATQWRNMKDNILKEIPSQTEICLVGAGIGALLVSVDVSRKFNIPVIDAGHVLNMMNSREDKSNGDRMFTLWQNDVGN
ncbi:hypothetical protein [uncultured Desulfosarcina sp.]|uniref:hypothetical protein n=1 Tax=uncultured Desulfosarcina sp. TaxID=218289 RepID=UPI0029C61164|nr:hypothetical protein [uncultured Desulfosarcina sp.]